MSAPSCADCAIWQAVTDKFGICRRFPPVPLVVQAAVDGSIVTSVRMFWSETQPAAWCAEHKPGSPMDRTEGNA